MNLNKVILAGNLTRDPELRYTSGGSAVCNLSIAVNKTYVDKQGEKKKDTSFFNLVAWAKQAETIAKYFTKGKAIYVEGELKNRSWEDKNGEKRSATDITIREFQFVGGKAGSGEGGKYGHGKTAQGNDVPF